MKGIYILVITFSGDVVEDIGSLGRMRFAKGLYAYVGSAQNSIEKRVRRHRSKNKKVFWHIDRLLGNRPAKITKVIYKKSDKQEECNMAERLRKTCAPVPHFGCSDCKCNSHLFKIRNLSDISSLGVKEL